MLLLCLVLVAIAIEALVGWRLGRRWYEWRDSELSLRTGDRMGRERDRRRGTS